MLKYFDLNERSKKAYSRNLDICHGDNGCESGEDCEGDTTLTSPTVKPQGPKILSTVEQLVMYAGVLIGVLFSSYVSGLSYGMVINTTYSLSLIVVSCVIALAIIPFVYEKLAINPSAPYIVQLGIFVQSGVFWHMLISSICRVFY